MRFFLLNRRAWFALLLCTSCHLPRELCMADNTLSLCIRRLTDEHPLVFRYGVAILVSLAALGIVLVLPYRREEPVLLFFQIAVAVVTWVAGWKAGVISLVFGAVAPVLATLGSLDAATLLRLAFNVVYMAAIVWVVASLSSSQKSLRTHADLLRLSFDAIIVWRLDGSIESWNRGAEQLYGYKESEALGHVTHELLKTVHPIPWPEVEKMLREQGQWEGELRHITKEGREVVVSARKQLVRGPDGIERIMETNRDITESKRAQEALRESEQRWSTTLKSIGDAVIATDREGRVTFMNQVAEKLTGWPLSEAQGRALNDVFNIISEVTRITPENPVERVIRAGQVVGLANHTALISRNGAELPIEDSGAPIRDGNGQLTGVVLVFHDIRDKRRAEKAVRESERLATTGRLASTLAHEIHNPLDKIGNLLFLIDHNPTTPETVRRQLLLASEEVKRITEITRNLLAFQREARNPVPINIGDVLDNVIALFERKIESAGIRIEKRVDVDEEFLGLPGEMRQVFANLISNAIEAVGKNGKIRLHAYCSTDWRRQRRGLRVTVIDNGPGIPADIRDKIFDPFFTTKGEGGTGLGLWITSGIVGNNDGILRFRTITRNGRSGTCFSVFIPFPEPRRPFILRRTG